MEVEFGEFFNPDSGTEQLDWFLALEVLANPQCRPFWDLMDVPSALTRNPDAISAIATSALAAQAPDDARAALDSVPAAVAAAYGTDAAHALVTWGRRYWVDPYESRLWERWGLLLPAMAEAFERGTEGLIPGLSSQVAYLAVCQFMADSAPGIYGESAPAVCDQGAPRVCTQTAPGCSVGGA
ncbi:MAG: hypothetical protein QOF51_1999 [Chloroflexota bacterium]|nr:hypothetical protein [Chloroflexota bacterium]